MSRTLLGALGIALFLAAWEVVGQTKLLGISWPPLSDVLEMLAEGLSNKMIAHRLSISDHTAKFHVNSILAKLNAGTRTEAVTRGIRLGLIKI